MTHSSTQATRYRFPLNDSVLGLRQSTSSSHRYKNIRLVGTSNAQQVLLSGNYFETATYTSRRSFGETARNSQFCQPRKKGFPTFPRFLNSNLMNARYSFSYAKNWIWSRGATRKQFIGPKTDGCPDNTFWHSISNLCASASFTSYRSDGTSNAILISSRCNGLELKSLHLYANWAVDWISSLMLIQKASLYTKST